jgi:predicted Fe-Mo cluster-binding NifX family protein
MQKSDFTPNENSDARKTATRAERSRKGKTMKIVFTTSGRDLNAPLDSRFGRAPKFLVYDLEGKTYELVDNRQNMNAVQGAGIQSAETVARLGAKALVTGYCGPKAFRALQAAGIKIFHTEAATVAEALDQYRGGSLTEADAANAEGHWA